MLRANRVSAGLFVIAALAICSAWNSWQISEELARQPSAAATPVQQAVLRLAAVSRVIPPGSVAAYLSGRGAEGFLSAQYAVAPTFLVMPDSPRRPRVGIGEFANPAAAAATAAKHGYRVRASLGQGVVLLERD